MGSAASSFSAGVAFGMKLEAARGVVKDALDSVYDAAEAVMGYLRTVASSALEKLKAAAAFLKDRVMKMVRRLRGRKEAAEARREVDRAAAAQADAGHDDGGVLSKASARVDNVKASLPPSSAIVVFSATAPNREQTLLGSVAARAARLASEMMALLETLVEAALGDSIPLDARSCISVVVAAVGIALEAIAALDAKDA